jgi:putative sigma-54 modulation protein
MQARFTARHMELTEALKSYVNAKLEKIKKYMDSVVDAHVTLSVEKYRHKAEVSIKGKKTTITGAEVSGDMYLSIDKVFDKIEKQIQKKKEKRVAKRVTRSDETIVAEEIELVERPEEAIDASEIVKQEIDNTIVETEIFDTKPMSTEEALMQFELTNNRFFVFRAQTAPHELNVLYRRNDGKLGLIRAK